MRAVVAALLLAGCQSMAWPVTKSTTVAELDARYRRETAEVLRSRQCWAYEDILTECPEWHEVWRHYWSARRELAELGQ